LAISQHQPRDVLAERRAQLESVARATTEQPSVLRLGMPVDDEVPIRAILVLADLRAEQRRLRQRREALGDEPARGLDALRRRVALALARIEWLASGIVRELESAAIVPRNPLAHSLGHVDPDRHLAFEKPRVSGWSAKVVDFLSRWLDPRPDDIGKHATQPGPAREHVVIGLEPASVRKQGPPFIAPEASSPG
jgi:hypothetical protein